jgi:hypothetical protein
MAVFHRGPKPLPGFKSIDVLAVLPLAIEADHSIRNAFLCRTDTDLQQIDERRVWEAIQAGQYREARRLHVGSRGG